MADRKRPATGVGEAAEKPATKSTRREVNPGNRRGQSRGRGRRRGAHVNAPPVGRDPVDTSRLVNFVTCSSLLYEGCRCAVDEFPEHLPSSFEDCDHYVRTFLPLLYEEARESVKTTFADCCEQDVFLDARVESVEMQGGAWMKVSVVLGRFHGRPTTVPRLFGNASVVLTNVRPTKRDPVENLLQKLKKHRVQKSEGKATATCPPTAIVAVVVQLEKDTRLLTMRTRPVCEAHQSDPSAPCHQLIDHLKNFPENWMLFPTGNLVTQQRECDILHSLNKIPLMNALLKPDQLLKMKIEDVPRKLPSEMGRGIRDYLDQTFDSSQRDAILMCTAHFCKDENSDGQQTLPVMMIQGPPGTGKTHTVVGILNLWHLVQFERYYKRVIGHYRNSDAAVMKKSERATTRTQMKPRILVCAPSNAAVDELLERILGHGFRDSSGQMYRPNLIRIGAEDINYSEEVKLVLLDTMVSNLMAARKNEWEMNFEFHIRRIKVLEQEIAELNRL